MYELRLLDPFGYLALHPRARVTATVEEAPHVERRLLTVIAPADAAAPHNEGAGYLARDYRVRTTPLEGNPVSELNFHLVDPADGTDEPVDLDDQGCVCDKPNDQYVMEINDGSVNLTHATCGKPPNWGDWEDLVYAEAMPVRVASESDCSGRMYSDYSFGCDCDYWFQITHVAGVEVAKSAEAVTDTNAMTDERLAELRQIGTEFGTVAEAADEIDRLRARVEQLNSQQVAAERLVQDAIDKDNAQVDTHEIADVLGMNTELASS